MTYACLKCGEEHTMSGMCMVNNCHGLIMTTDHVAFKGTAGQLKWMARQRPGVMIQAKEEGALTAVVTAVDYNEGAVTVKLATLEDVVNFELGIEVRLALPWIPAVKAEDKCEMFGIDRSAARLPAPPAERTCTVCSKTCDVGKCWWCGNE